MVDIGEYDPDKEAMLNAVFDTIEPADMEIGESYVFIQVPKNESQIRKAKDMIDEHLVQHGMDEQLTPVERKTSRLVSGSELENEHLKEIEDGKVGIGVERIK